MRKRLEFERDIRVYRMRSDEEGLRAEDAALRQQRQLRLAQLEIVSKNDIQGKLALEEAKLRIEQEYAARSVSLAETIAKQKATIEIETNPKFREEIETALQRASRKSATRPRRTGN